MSVLFGTGLSDEDKKILAWAKKEWTIHREMFKPLRPHP